MNTSPTRHRALSARRRRAGVGALMVGALAFVLGACGGAASPSATGGGGPSHPSSEGTGTQRDARPAPTTAPTTTTTIPHTVSPGVHGPVTSPPLPTPGPGFVEGHVTAVGDSVMIDYQDELEEAMPGIDVEAEVSRQWSDGEAVVQQLKAEGQLGAVVIVGLGTNGLLSEADIDSMMSILTGASRVVFVTIHVDQSYQDANNAELEAATSRYPNVVIADWYTLATENPGLLYGDLTHLPIDGPGAQALASLVAAKA